MGQHDVPDLPPSSDREGAGHLREIRVDAATDGIGAAVATARTYLDTPTVFAWAVVAVAFAWLVDALVLGPVRRRTLRWAAG